MSHACPSGKTGLHEFAVQGTPHSAMTWYVCLLCGYRKERGPGLFFREHREPTVNAVWSVKHYVGTDWPVIKGRHGIEIECAGATREQAERIAEILSEHY
jgi:hypothetical protein